MTRDPSTADGPGMSAAARDAFLDRPLIARFATSADGQPRVLPMWYLWDGSDVWMETSPTFPNVATLRRNPRAALVIDESLGGTQLRAVVMRGEVDIHDEPVDDVLATVKRIYARYLNPDQMARDGEAMLHGGSHVLLRFRPKVIKTWDTTTA